VGFLSEKGVYVAANHDPAHIGAGRLQLIRARSDTDSCADPHAQPDAFRYQHRSTNSGCVGRQQYAQRIADANRHTHLNHHADTQHYTNINRVAYA
jgi:hypothetical protein